MSRSVRGLFLALLTAVACLGLAPPAGATVTVGQVAPSVAAVNQCSFPDPYDELQLTVATGAGYVVAPSGGVLTAWSTLAGDEPNQSVSFKVFRPLGGEDFRVVALDGPRSLIPSTLNSFAVNIPVLAGDVIGFAVAGGTVAPCSFSTDLEADSYGYRKGNAAVGEVISIPEEGPSQGGRLNVSATLLPPPAITSLSPPKGSIKGVKTTIAGANFASVSSVSFGGVAAKSFSVDSEGQITAFAPASKTLAKVPVTVTTIAGTATSIVKYAYEGCTVPKLDGKRLKASKKKARRAGCGIGKVTKKGDATAKTGEVVKQSPKPGKVLAPGTQIKLTLE